MAKRMSDIRVGIPVIGGRSWMGGVTYVELLVKALTALPPQERPQLFLVVREHNLHDLYLFEPFMTCFDEIIYVGSGADSAQKKLKNTFRYFANFDDMYNYLDFFFPIQMDAYPNRAAASWIPDFQHKHLPEFFSPDEIRTRDEQCGRIAELANIVVLSSNKAQRDFCQFYPKSRAVTRVLSFFHRPQLEWFDWDPRITQDKYDLPERFAVCCNQFWMHKNHKLLFHALADLRNQSMPIHVVCTGATQDYRQPGYFEDIKRLVDNLGIADIVHILGVIPREDQLQLLRRSLFLVQPSLYEGWSTVVEDGRMLGRKMLLSNIEVHREQDPIGAIYFDHANKKDLADKLAHLNTLSVPGPDEKAEHTARENAIRFSEQYARSFIDLVNLSQVVFPRS